MTWTILPPRARAASCGGSVLLVISALPATTPCNAAGAESKSCSWPFKPSFCRKPFLTAMTMSDMSIDGATATVTVGFVALGCCAAAAVAHSTVPIISNITVRMIKSFPNVDLGRPGPAVNSLGGLLLTPHDADFEQD